MIRAKIALFLLWLAALPAHAGCDGTDLLDAMPADQRASLRAAADAQPYANGLLWRAERGDSVVHLVGTLHAPDPRHADTMAQITPLIDRASTVFLEFGDGDEARLQADMARNPGLAFIIDGPTLPEMLSRADWQALRGAMNDRGVPGFLAAKMKPWMAMLSLSMTKCAFQQAAKRQGGLDHLILGYARETGNPAQALEPYDSALTLMDHYSTEEQLELLSLNLAMGLDNPNDQHTTLVEAYFREEIRLIWEHGIAVSLTAPGQTREKVLADAARMEDAIVTRRNVQWMGRILPAAQAGEVFLAAGALHLPGETGLLNLLAEEGYRITRVPLTR